MKWDYLISEDLNHPTYVLNWSFHGENVWKSTISSQNFHPKLNYGAILSLSTKSFLEVKYLKFGPRKSNLFDGCHYLESSKIHSCCFPWTIGKTRQNTIGSKTRTLPTLEQSTNPLLGVVRWHLINITLTLLMSCGLIKNLNSALKVPCARMHDWRGGPVGMWGWCFFEAL